MKSVFVSYAQVDRQRVMPLARALEGHGWNVWWDRDIPPGKTWDEVIEEQLDAAGAVIAVWTEAGVKSRWVRTEAAEGLSRGVLVPVLLEETRVPLAFRQIQAANLTDWEPGVEHVGFQNLVDALESLLGGTAREEAASREVAREAVAERQETAEAVSVEDLAERALTQARALAARGDWADVIAVLGLVDEETQDLRETHPEAVALLEVARRQVEAADLYDEAEVLFSSGQFEEAIERLDRAQNLDSENELAAELRAKAVRHIERRRQESLDHEYSRARGALEARDWHVAVARLELLLAEAPDRADALAELERARAGVEADRRYRELQELLRLEQWDEVVAGLDALAEEHPDFGDPDDLRGQAEAGRRTAAAEMSGSEATAETAARGPIGPPREPPSAGDTSASEVVAAITGEPQEAAESPSTMTTGEAKMASGTVTVSDEDQSGSKPRAVIAAVGVAVVGIIAAVALIVALVTNNDGEPGVVPSNDDFGNALLISGNAGSEVGSTEFATKEPDEPDHAGESGESSVWFEWQGSAGELEIDVDGLDFDPVMAVYTGGSVDGLTEVTSDDDSGGGSDSRVEFRAEDGRSYYIALDGFFADDSGDYVLTWTFSQADAEGGVGEETSDGEPAEGASSDDDQLVSGGAGVCTSDGVLSIGTLLPVTGNLAFLGPQQLAATELAIQDINDAGGLRGVDVIIEQGDSGDTSSDQASVEVERLLVGGADAIVGASSTDVSLGVIDDITGSCVIQFSPANTSSVFTTYADNDLYFRTAPPDVVQGAALAEAMIADGASEAAFLVIDDSYGTGLLEFTSDPFEELGGVVVSEQTYDPHAGNFDSEVAAVVDADPDAVVIIGFRETSAILSSLIDAGYGPDNVLVYGADGNMGNALASDFADPSVLAGMRGTVPGVNVVEELPGFRDRLLEFDPGLMDFSYSAESYDAVVIIALAAAIAGDDNGAAIAAEIVGVTREGEKCTNYRDCAELVGAGTDIDYDGLSGPLEFADAGEPTVASILILEFDDAGEIFVAGSIVGST